ncbi:hypothetical protein DM872_26585 [Pseudomonas taiwanensis]|nr:hypothetical protein [Pseudomonas taiwanensis]
MSAWYVGASQKTLAKAKTYPPTDDARLCIVMHNGAFPSSDEHHTWPVTPLHRIARLSGRPSCCLRTHTCKSRPWQMQTMSPLPGSSEWPFNAS